MNMNGVYPAPGYSQQIPYQASYGYNPYGNQQRIEQPQNYFQPAQTQQIQQPQMTPIGINGKIVPSVENITANDVPMDGSVAFFQSRICRKYTPKAGTQMVQSVQSFLSRF